MAKGLIVGENGMCKDKAEDNTQLHKGATGSTAEDFNFIPTIRHEEPTDMDARDTATHFNWIFSSRSRS